MHPLFLTQGLSLPSSTELLPGALGAVGASTEQDQAHINGIVQDSPACLVMGALRLCGFWRPDHGHGALCSPPVEHILHVQPAAMSPPAGTFSNAAGSQEEAPESARTLQSHPLPPSPLLPLETGVMGAARSASPIGSQFRSLQHGDHSASLGAGFLFQSDHDDIPSPPRRDTREVSNRLTHGDC